MANSAYPAGAFFKHTTAKPAVMLKKTKQKAEDAEWRRTCDAVDARDQKRCQITGAALQAGAADPWAALERHHLEPRSRNKSRRFTATNVLTVSRAVHQLLHAGVLILLDKRGERVTAVEALDHVAWDRTRVARLDEPCRIKRGLAVVDLEKVAR